MLEACLELVKLAFLLVEVFYQTATALLHLVEPALKTDPERSLVSLAMLDLVIRDRVLRVPHVVSDELLDLDLPGGFQGGIIHILDLIHQTVNVFNQDVITGNQYSLLLLL